MPRRPDDHLWLTLEAVPGLGPEAVRALLEQFATPLDIVSASHHQLSGVVGGKLADAIRQSAEAGPRADDLVWLEADDNHLLTASDPAWPAQLNDLPDPPVWLYVKGDPAWLARPMLAVVGSRHATTQGKRDAQAFAQALSEAGLTIVSGLALGIDTAAHEGGLAGLASSVAVVGTGLDRVYPARNRDLAHRLAAQGALVSEFALGCEPRPGHFPRRNRIISGLSLGVLVVEAAPDSGSLITARQAGEQGREIFAMPGSIHSALSRGCHELIKRGAKLVETATDILEDLGRHLPRQDAIATAEASADPVLKALTSTPLAIDQLAERLGLTVEALSVRLLAAEMDGLVARLPGGLYQRLF